MNIHVSFNVVHYTSQQGKTAHVMQIPVMTCERRYILYNLLTFLLLIILVYIKCEVGIEVLPSISKYIPALALNRVKLIANRTNARKPAGTSVSLTSVPPNSNSTLASRSGLLCPIFYAGFGNQIFQFASTFGIAKAKNMTILINRWSLVNRIFKINVTIVNDDSVCNSFEIRREKFPAKYDRQLIDFNSSNSFRLGTFLQSWKYFYPFREELRRQLQFRKSIRKYAENFITQICQDNGVKRSYATLIGVHVRRGDMVNHKSGFNVAPADYLKHAVDYFKQKYGNNIIFIVASNGMSWTKKNMPKNLNVRYSNGGRENDMAVLASCDHVITTVGSFGWWSGWLAGGEVTYYRFPAKKGSLLYSAINHEDYFYPGWVAL